jgi:hypothetical protein
MAPTPDMSAYRTSGWSRYSTGLHLALLPIPPSSEASGSSTDAKPARFKRIGGDVAGYRVLIVDVAQRSQMRIDEMFGEDILREFSTVSIDYEAGVIEFWK